MKERDLFAALAMQEILRWEIEVVMKEAKEKEEKSINLALLARNSYILADEMVRAGKKQKLPADIENIA